MGTSFIHSFQSEMLKKKRSAASWLVLLSALFMPSIVLFARIISPVYLTYKENSSKHAWDVIYMRNWTAMGMFFLPLAIILFAQLFAGYYLAVLQTTPQKLTTIFFAKFSVIMVMLLQLFVVFNIGIYLSSVIPALLFKAVPYPTAPYPFLIYLKSNFKFFIDCLPVVALQYLLSLQFKNFLVPIAGGFALLITSLLALNWKYGYLIPYTYCPLNFKENQGKVDVAVNIHACSLIYFTALTIISYILYIKKKEKG